MGLTEFIATHATAIIQQLGYLGVFFLMMLESMIFPVPSEAVMPFAGFLIQSGRFSWLGVLAVSSLGSFVGSLISYAIGRYGGEPFLKRYGKWFLLSSHDLDMTHRYFNKSGFRVIFIARFIPVVRHLISIPAGLSEMPLKPFLLATILGASIWNICLASVGFILKHWVSVMKYSHILDKVVVGLLVLALGWFVYSHVRRK